MIFDPPSDSLAAEKDSPKGHIHFAKLPGMWERTLTVGIFRDLRSHAPGELSWKDLRHHRMANRQRACGCGLSHAPGWIIGPTQWMEPIQRFMPNLQPQTELVLSSHHLAIGSAPPR